MKLFTIPNLLTLGNLFCGSLAVLFLTEQFGGSYGIISVPVLMLMLISLILDLLDGMVARITNSHSEIGVQLDSLADMVSFGLVPGIIMFQMLNSFPDFRNFSFIGLSIILFSALRLAKFNVDTEQSTYFKGLATPANAILIFSLYWIILDRDSLIHENIDPFLLIATTIVSSILLISNMPLFSFKFKGFAWKDNHYKYVFLIISAILLVLFQMNSVPFIILLYIIISIIFRKKIINA